MESPDHNCNDPHCDPEDDAHKIRRKQRNVRARAQFKADQAWAQAREALPELLKVREKLSGHAHLIQDDVEVIDMALSLVLGELYLRQSQSFESGY